MSRHLRSITLFVALGFAAGCDSLSPSGAILEFEIAPNRVACEGVGGPAFCMQIRARPQDEWQRFSCPIENLSREDGYLYRVRVLARTIDRPPADGCGVEYRLVRTIRREFVGAFT